MDNFDTLKNAFSRFRDYYLIGNEHLYDPMFHAFVSAVYKPRMYYNGSFVIARVFPFFLQPSGTGKSQAMKCVYWAVKNCGLDLSSEKITTLTDASLIGTFYENKKGEAVKKEGILKTCDFLYFDEADFITKSSKWTDDIYEILHSAMDDDAWLSRHMRLGSIQYKTQCTIMGGSYVTESINLSILRKGLFQRSLMSYKSFTPEEMRQMVSQLNELSVKKGFQREAEMRTNLEPIVKEINGQVSSLQPLSINVADLKRFSDGDFMRYYDETICNQYIGQRQEVLQSFFNRMMSKMIHIACHRAYINCSKEILYDDLEYGFNVSRISIKSVKNLLDTLYKPKDEENSEEYMGKIIVSMLSSKPLSQKMILDHTDKMRAKRLWFLERKRTMHLLHDESFLKKFSICVVKGEKNSRMYELEV